MTSANDLSYADTSITMQQTLSNLIFSANNPFQEGVPFIQGEDVHNVLGDRFQHDFAYSTSLKSVWNRQKQLLKINCCFNIL